MRTPMSLEQKISLMDEKLSVIEAEIAKHAAVRSLLAGDVRERLHHFLTHASEQKDVKPREWNGWSVSSLYVEFTIPGSWAMETNVSLNFSGCDSEFGLVLKAELTWSSTGREIPQALLAVSQYQKAIEFACLCESVFNR